MSNYCIAYRCLNCNELVLHENTIFEADNLDSVNIFIDPYSNLKVTLPSSDNLNYSAFYKHHCKDGVLGNLVFAGIKKIDNESFDGVKNSKYDIRDYKLSVTGNVNNLPEEFTLDYIPEVKNQKNVNSCVAHVCASIEEYFEHEQCNEKETLSPGFIYGTRYDYTGKGMYLKDALKTLCEKGICKQDKFPYNKEVPEILDLVKNANITDNDTSHCKISRYFKCDKINDIKSAIYNYGPVIMSVPWFNDNKVEKDILIKGTNKSGNHAIYVYGWNSKGFCFMNSWGKGWANEGKCILPYDYPINETWGITDDYAYPHDTFIVEPKRNKFLDFVYKIINWVGNIIKKLFIDKE